MKRTINEKNFYLLNGKFTRSKKRLNEDKNSIYECVEKELLSGLHNKY